MIAKIPEPLSRHIARTFLPQRLEAADTDTMAFQVGRKYRTKNGAEYVITEILPDGTVVGYPAQSRATWRNDGASEYYHVRNGLDLHDLIPEDVWHG